MPSNLFHADVYLPAWLAAARYTGKLRYSAHARNEAVSDKYGRIELPPALNQAGGRLIEVEAVDGPNGPLTVASKIVWRQPLDVERDLVLVVMLADGFVRTVWVNLNDDAHRSLNTARYVQPPKPTR